MRSQRMIFAVFLVSCLILLGSAIVIVPQIIAQGGTTPTFDPNYTPVPNTYTGVAVVSMGEGELLEDNSLTQSCSTGERFVSGASGSVTSDDGSIWIVPMQVNQGAGSVDMFNNCEGIGDNPMYLDELETVVIDPDGEVITATIFADNYFELYVNGVFVGRDNINFVPFNSSIVRFQASYPMTIAVKMADWEDHYGIGMEYANYNVGDGGFIASFDNQVVTNAAWKVLPVYIAPLDDPGCVIEDEFGNPDSSACSISPVCSDQNAATCRALHYEIPENWQASDFDDSQWQGATLYEAARVTNQAGYSNYAGRFGTADFIWSGNLNLDNLVLARFTLEAPLAQ